MGCNECYLKGDFFPMTGRCSVKLVHVSEIEHCQINTMFNALVLCDIVVFMVGMLYHLTIIIEK